MAHHFGYHEPPLDPHDCPICAEAHEVQGEEIAMRAAEAANSDALERTREEIDLLKLNWLNDACWDIEDTPGFERHYEELYAYRQEAEAKQKKASREMLLDKAAELGCPENIALAEYVTRLEDELDTLREEVGEMRLTLGYRV